MTSNRRGVVLMTVLLAGVAYYGWTRVAAKRGSVPPTSSHRAGSTASGADVGWVERLDVKRLDRKPGVYEQGRNLFGYGQKPPPPTAPEPPPKPKPNPRPASEVVSQPPKPKPPPIDVVYLGSFGRSERRIAVFWDDQNIYNAVVGDVINDKFILVTIGYESADLGFVGFPDASPTRLAIGG